MLGELRAWGVSGWDRQGQKCTEGKGDGKEMLCPGERWPSAPQEQISDKHYCCNFGKIISGSLLCSRNAYISDVPLFI